MKFKEIARRLTGISSPIFGVSWSPSESETKVAKRVVTELEDRRVLYNPSEMEVPRYCVQSIIDIRRMLSKEISSLDSNSNLSNSLRAMRASCRKFLDAVTKDERIVEFGFSAGHFASWQFNSAVGELRGVFGVHIAQIATQHGLDVEDDLATILPVVDNEKET